MWVRIELNVLLFDGLIQVDIIDLKLSSYYQGYQARLELVFDRFLSHRKKDWWILSLFFFLSYSKMLRKSFLRREGECKMRKKKK